MVGEDGVVILQLGINAMVTPRITMKRHITRRQHSIALPIRWLRRRYTGDEYW